MYKKAACLITLSIFSFIPFSNVFSQSTFDYGIHISKNGATQTFNEDGINMPINARFDLAFAFIMAKELNPWLSIKLEPGYTVRGFEGNFSSLNYGDGNFGTKLNYLSMPVLAKVQFLKTNIAPFIEAGPRIDWLFKKQFTGIVPDEYHNMIDDYNRFAVGFSVGTGLNLNIFNGISNELGLRFNYDLSNSYDDGFTAVKNESAAFYLSFSLNP